MPTVLFSFRSFAFGLTAHLPPLSGIIISYMRLSSSSQHYVTDCSMSDLGINLTLFFFKDFIYLFDRGRERAHKQGEQQAEGEGEAGPSPRRGPDTGTRSQNPRITT